MPQGLEDLDQVSFSTKAMHTRTPNLYSRRASITIDLILRSGTSLH